MSRHRESVTLLGRTNFRDRRRVFGIRGSDRRSHIYVVGRTGTGKSHLLESIARQDILNGQGFALLDPHGDLAEHVVAAVPPERRADLVYFNLPDRSPPFGFNPLIGVAPSIRPLAAAGLLDAFRTVWRDFWGPRLEHILRNALLALLDQPSPTLADVSRLLADARYRKEAMFRVGNQVVREFWLREFECYPTRLRAEAIAPLQNKLGAFLSDVTLHSLLTHPRGALDLRRLMDERRILIVNLAKGRIGADAASLFGSLLVSQLAVAAMARADTAEDERRDFWVHLDEFQTLAGAGLAPMLAELRKYRVGLTLANQHLDQLDPVVREAVLGNTGTLVCFRLGPSDAELIEQEFRPEFGSTDLVNLPNRHIYIRLMVDGAVARPFSAETLPAAKAPPPGSADHLYPDGPSTPSRSTLPTKTISSHGRSVYDL